MVKVKMLSRNPDHYMRETKFDIHKAPRNYAPEMHPFQEAREYQRALNATKLERVFAKPFLGSLDGHTEGISVIARHEKQLSLTLSGSYDGEVRVWNLPLKKCVTRVQAHTGWHWSLPIGAEWPEELDEPSFSVTSKSALLGVSHHWLRPQYVTCGETVNVYDHHRNTATRTFDWGCDTVYRVSYNPIETELIGGVSSDRGIVLYDTREKVPLKKMIMKLRSNTLCWNPMEAFIFSVANEDYNAYTFDMRNLSAPLNIHMDHTEAVMDLCYSPTGREFVTGSYDKSIRIFPTNRGRSREVYHTKRMQRVIAVSWSMDGKFITSGSDEMNLRLWKANAAEKLGPLRPREERAFRYNEALKDKFGHHPEIRRIARHRQVPKHIMNAKREHTIIRESRKRKEANRRNHSKPGTVPHVSERKKHVLRQED